MAVFDGLYGASTRRSDDALEIGCAHIERIGGGAQPIGRTLHSEREHRIEPHRAAIFQRHCCRAKERLGKQIARVRPDGRKSIGPASGEDMYRTDTQLVKQTEELVLDNIGQCADDQQLGACRCRDRAFRNQCGEAGILPFRKRRLDAAT